MARAPSAATPACGAAGAARRDAEPDRPTGREASPIDVTDSLRDGAGPSISNILLSERNFPVMRQFNLKQGWLVPDPVDAECAPGRTIHPEELRMAEPGWARQRGNGRAQTVRGTVEHNHGETVMRPEGEVEDDELRSAREWLWHVQAGRIGPEHRG